MEFDSCGENVNELTKSLKSVWRKSYCGKLFIADLVFGVIRLLTYSIDGWHALLNRNKFFFKFILQINKFKRQGLFRHSYPCALPTSCMYVSVDATVYDLTRLCSATTYADNVALPAFAHRMLLLLQSIDISGPPQLSAVARCTDA